MGKISLMIVLLCIVTVSYQVRSEVVTRIYTPDLAEAKWISFSSKTACHLSQKIPLYGEVIFSYRADDTVSMNVWVDNPPMRKGYARLYSVPSVWKAERATLDLGKVEIDSSQSPFEFEHQMARRVMKELEQGNYPTIVYEDWLDAIDDVKVVISPVNFRDAVLEHRQCVVGLDPMEMETKIQRISFRSQNPKESNGSGSEGPGLSGSGSDEPELLGSKSEGPGLNGSGSDGPGLTGSGSNASEGERLEGMRSSTVAEDTGETVVYFPFDVDRLDASGMKTLDVLAEFMMSHPEFTLLIATGHTDSKGTDQYNMDLGMRRANSVSQYLVSKGIEPATIKRQTEGEHSPIDRNDTEIGRANNRRTHLKPYTEKDS